MDSFTYLLIEAILKSPHEFKWQVQGLGMMRLYLSPAVRIHIWDSSLRVPGVSALHTHPWDMKSTVVAGFYKQHRYLRPVDAPYHTFSDFNCVTIKCGEGACTVDEIVKVQLAEQPLEVYSPGQFYLQRHDEIHLSCPEDGTVTLVERTFLEDKDHAMVFWRGKRGWVDAEPRAATREEVEAVTSRALDTWFVGVAQ